MNIPDKANTTSNILKSNFLSDILNCLILNRNTLYNLLHQLFKYRLNFNLVCNKQRTKIKFTLILFILNTGIQYIKALISNKAFKKYFCLIIKYTEL